MKKILTLFMVGTILFTYAKEMDCVIEIQSVKHDTNTYTSCAQTG